MPTIRVGDLAASKSRAFAAASSLLLLPPSLKAVLATDCSAPCCGVCFCLLPKPRPLLGGVEAAATTRRLRTAARHATRAPTTGCSTPAMLPRCRHRPKRPSRQAPRLFGGGAVKSTEAFLREGSVAGRAPRSWPAYGPIWSTLAPGLSAACCLWSSSRIGAPTRPTHPLLAVPSAPSAQPRCSDTPALCWTCACVGQHTQGQVSGGQPVAVGAAKEAGGGDC